MKVSDALRARKSVRAFTEQAVSEEQVRLILDAARCAPSGVNTQPWRVAVVTGDAKQQLQTRIETAFRAGEPSAQEYQYYPKEWREPYRSRRKETGLMLYSAVGIAREDKQKRQDQWAANYRSFDAPVMLLFLMDSVMETGSYMDYGMFIQSAMLMATEMGLATCPQAALAEYPNIVRDQLAYDASTTVVCGMALGYEDTSAVINRYRTPREVVDSFTHFFDEVEL
ncbi:MAG: nitroreductase [Cellvibrionaceae bacterium]|jgi:nitroreductase